MFFFIFIPITSSVFGATLKFDPETVSTPSGKMFTVNVNVDAGSTQIKGAEAFITYDSNLLEVQAGSIVSGGLFKTFQKDTTVGKVYMAGLADSTTDVVSAPGTLGKVTFKALTDGTATLEFYCDSAQKKGSSIIQNDANDTNIIECSLNGSSAITIGSGTTVTPTITTAEPTPSTLPKSGVFDNVVKFAVPGLVLLLVGVATRLLL